MRVLCVAAAALWLTGCYGGPEPAAKNAPEAASAPISGRQAFQYMYGSARIWEPDAQPLTIRSMNVAGVASDPGQAGAWEIVFVSATAHMARTYTWSAIEAEGLHKGVFPGSRQGWNPGGADRPFDAAEVRTDTPEALEAAKKDSAGYLSKPGQRPAVNFLLDASGRFPTPTWKVMWGNTVSSAEYTVTVDASTGKVLAKE